MKRPAANVSSIVGIRGRQLLTIGFEREVVALIPRLRRFAASLSCDRDAGDDLCQATLERALRNRHLWADGSRLDSWMYRMMRNIWIDTLRSQKRRPETIDSEIIAETFGAPGAQEAVVELSMIDRAMNQLPAEQREAVSLVMIEGFGYKEASEIIGCPPGTLNSRLVRGRDKLLGLLGETA